MGIVTRFYRRKANHEDCFYVESTHPLSKEDDQKICWLIGQPGKSTEVSLTTTYPGNVPLVEVGPRLSFATAFSSNVVSICQAIGLGHVIRFEHSRRVIGNTPPKFDRMTEMIYPSPLTSFDSGVLPEPVRVIPVLEEGPECLRSINRALGLGYTPEDIEFIGKIFVGLDRNPTDVELFQLAQSLSEHCRHWKFKGWSKIDGVTMPHTLFELVKSTLRANPKGSLVAFSDNSSAIVGFNTRYQVVEIPGLPSEFVVRVGNVNYIFTAETHNHPSRIAAYYGAETGTGGRIRDVQAFGRGGIVVAGTAGFAVGNLQIHGYPIPGEDPRLTYPSEYAKPLEVLLNMAAGAFHYGNEFGEPCINGFCRTFDQMVGDQRFGFVKPIMFTGGVGEAHAEHTHKHEPEVGMLVIMIGGPAYRIGVGGGASSSMVGGANSDLDYNSVQRGDAEMANRVNRVIRACIARGEGNPIQSIHDQGAGGPSNVLSELVSPLGARLEVRNINVGDTTLSILEMLGAESQERNGVVIKPEDLPWFRALCEAEHVPCEVLGEITGDGHFVITDANDNTTPVNLNLATVLGDLPTRSYSDERVPLTTTPFILPYFDLNLATIIEKVLRLPSVGSKRFLVEGVDRSVGGKVVAQQCVGPFQLPVNDYAIIGNLIENELGGCATSIGEQPIKLLIDAAAGARMAVGEALTNLAGAVVLDRYQIKASGNEMFAASIPGELARLYDAVAAASEVMIKLGLAIDGGKDSLSMAVTFDGKTVVSPGQLVISLYAAMPDVRLHATPDIKRPGESSLILIDLGNGRNRLGGSALAQAYTTIGNETPDVDNPAALADAFDAVQLLVKLGLVEAYHDRSDGGLATTLIEMVLAAGCGLNLTIPATRIVPRDLESLPFLFNEELGMVIEVDINKRARVEELLATYSLPTIYLGDTCLEPNVTIRQGGREILNVSTNTLRTWFEATSDRLKAERTNPVYAAEEKAGHAKRVRPYYHLSFEPMPSPAEGLALRGPERPRVAILRAEGSNGEREMAAAFTAAGFTTYDVNMSHLVGGKTSLDYFQGLALVGGFSYADVLGSAKGWAGLIRYNNQLAEMFQRFFARPDTFSLAVCNGCQLAGLLGVFPWAGIPEGDGPVFVGNASGRFESRFATVRVLESPSIMLRGMAGSVLGIHVAHGEGRLRCPPDLLKEIIAKNLAPLVYTNDQGGATEAYPFNPNGSPGGITALTTPDGRHLAMMPHPERTVLLRQWPYLPPKFGTLTTSPWHQMFLNAWEWCDENR